MALGKTVAEVQTTISGREIELWGRYREKYGPLNPVRMFDSGPAMISSILVNANGGKATPKDFMPYGRKIDDSGDEIISADEMISKMMKMSNFKVGR